VLSPVTTISHSTLVRVARAARVFEEPAGDRGEGNIVL
jgi:hypothetical protein